MNTIELNQSLEKHKLWLANNSDGKRADLSGADLRQANLCRVNLRQANLCRVDLRQANLSGANLPSPTILLLCYWGEVSDKLTTQLMQYDASNHPNPEMFDTWASGGECPYSNGTKWQRCAYFKEKGELWKTGDPLSALELVLALFKERNIKR